MDSYFRKNQQIAEMNKSFDKIRNPESEAQNQIQIESEFNPQGNVSLVHTYKKNNHMYHKSHSFTRDMLKQFLNKI